MNITLRTKELKGGKESLYLDYYLPNNKQKRKKESLKLYLYQKPKTAIEKDHNKKTRLLAESIRSKKLLEMQHQLSGFGHLIKNKNQYNFLDYFTQMAEEKVGSKGNYSVWISTLEQLKKYADPELKLHEIDEDWLNDFKDHLQNNARTKSNKKLSQNTLYSYFNKVRACINEAFRTKKIERNPVEGISGFKQGESERQYLTLEELRGLAKTDCEVPILKSAFIFSCLTGLRWSDINKLTWKEVQFSESGGWVLRIRQQKTKELNSLPISEQAREYIGEPEHADERVFKGLKYSAWYNVKLQQWVMQAGISKTITFHSARHTYATLQLTLGTDIYTVSKLLGHKDIRTTEVYAKIIDQKKIDAANVIPKLL